MEHCKEDEYFSNHDLVILFLGDDGIAENILEKGKNLIPDKILEKFSMINFEDKKNYRI